MSGVVSWLALNPVWLAFLSAAARLTWGWTLWLESCWIVSHALLSGCRFLAVPTNLYWASHQRFPQKGAAVLYHCPECLILIPILTAGVHLHGAADNPQHMILDYRFSRQSCCVWFFCRLYLPHTTAGRHHFAHYACCFRLFWPMFRLQSHMVTRFERRKFSGAATIKMVLLLVLSFLKTSLYFMGAMCLRF